MRRLVLVTFQRSCQVWVPLVMPSLVTSEHNKDYYDPNVVYTSFGRNKNQQPSDSHSQGRVGGGGHH